MKVVTPAMTIETLIRKIFHNINTRLRPNTRLRLKDRPGNQMNHLAMWETTSSKWWKDKSRIDWTGRLNFTIAKVLSFPILSSRGLTFFYKKNPYTVALNALKAKFLTKFLLTNNPLNGIPICQNPTSNRCGYLNKSLSKMKREYYSEIWGSNTSSSN